MSIMYTCIHTHNAWPRAGHTCVAAEAARPRLRRAGLARRRGDQRTHRPVPVPVVRGVNVLVDTAM